MSIATFLDWWQLVRSGCPRFFLRRHVRIIVRHLLRQVRLDLGRLIWIGSGVHARVLGPLAFSYDKHVESLRPWHVL